MRHARTLFLFVALALPLAGRAQTPAQTASPATAVAAARVESVPFESRLVGARLAYNVVLPPGYDAKSAARTRYPVLYLLHGLAGSANDWVSKRAHLADYAAQHRMIIVVPEGKDGWYTDSATVPNEKFETYFVEELLPDVQKRFRAIEAREGRAVAGLSMGGYGALKFGLKYPERFAFAASMSGALAVASWLATDPIPAFAKPSVARVFGAADNPVRAANGLFRIAREMPAERIASLPYLYLDCGTEDRLLGFSRDFAALLVEKKIPHEYRQLPGNHSWPYWDRQVQEVLKLAARRLAQPQTRQ
ncbi:MAG: esterase family protein [Acidobacteria bacterium]|nr:esterase family protein [Acidobacteriota bacterium]MCA1642277.1 esterase family protein [Acidobacteriota bacterium]